MTGDYSLLLSNNHATGGTCFGDSGGPNYLKDTTVIAGVTSFGLNGNCAGTGGAFRLHRENVLNGSREEAENHGPAKPGPRLLPGRHDFEAFGPMAGDRQRPKHPYPVHARKTTTMVEDFMRVVATVLWGAAVVAVSVLGYLAY